MFVRNTPKFMYRALVNYPIHNLNAFQCPKFFSSSPYSVLNIKASATVQDIKQAFRKVSKGVSEWPTGARNNTTSLYKVHVRH